MACEVSGRSFELRVSVEVKLCFTETIDPGVMPIFSGILNETMGGHHATRAQTHSIHCHTHKHARTHMPVCLSNLYLYWDQWSCLASTYLCPRVPCSAPICCPTPVLRGAVLRATCPAPSQLYQPHIQLPIGYIGPSLAWVFLS